MPKCIPSNTPVCHDASSTMNFRQREILIYLSKTWKGALWTQATSQQHCTVSCHYYSTCYERHPICPKVNSTQLISKNQKTKAIALMGKKNKQDLTRFCKETRSTHINIAPFFLDCTVNEKLSGRVIDTFKRKSEVWGSIFSKTKVSKLWDYKVPKFSRRQI